MPNIRERCLVKAGKGKIKSKERRFSRIYNKKIKEYFEMLEKFKIGFEIFNANFSKMSEQEKEVEELMAELEKLEGENLFFI
mgnify:CR=1 FL=1